MAEVKDLPGWPSKRLVTDVKRELWRFVRSRPHVNDRAWRMAWEWAANIERNDIRHILKSYRNRRLWPRPHEIASQYLFLCLVDMRSSCSLALPFGSAKHLPNTVQDDLKLIGTLKSSTNGFGLESDMKLNPPKAKRIENKKGITANDTQ